MGRSPCCSKKGLNKGAWTALEDKILKSYIKSHGEGNWRSLPKRAGLKRCGKSCRLRWLNYLRPDIKRGNISGDEEELIIRLHNLLGNRWSLIAGRLPGRTDNEIKNYWNTTLGKKAKQPSSNSPNSSPMSNNIQTTTTKPQLDGERFVAHNRNSEAKVIRTKATRCSTKVIVVRSPIADHNIHDQTSSPASREPHDDSPVNDEALTNGAPAQDDGETFAGGFGPINYSAELSIEDLGLSLPFDVHEPVFDDWVPSTTTYDSCLGQEENGNLDLASLAFLLDSDEWP